MTLNRTWISFGQQLIFGQIHISLKDIFTNAKNFAEKFENFDEEIAKVMLDQNLMQPIKCYEMRPSLNSLNHTYGVCS